MGVNGLMIDVECLGNFFVSQVKVGQMCDFGFVWGEVIII